jgi:hypothetical protein
MFTIISSLFFVLRRGLQTQVALHAEILALRHQLLVLQRSNRGNRPRLSLADRIVWVWLWRLWSGWQSALVVVKPETVIAWHRKGFRLYWRWRSRHPQGRPSVLREVIGLIRTILAEWVTHYNQGRPHASLGPGLHEPADALLPPRPHHRHSLDQNYTVAARAILGGLHHEYRWERIAA